MYKVIKYFTDLHDNNYPYKAGDTFPRKGLSVTEGRFAELAGKNNKQGVPLIKLVEETSQVEEAPAKNTKKTPKSKSL